MNQTLELLDIGMSLKGALFCYGMSPLLLTWINFTPRRGSNYIHYEMWDEIAYPFPNFNVRTVEV